MVSLLAISTLLSFALAQTKTITLPFLGYDDTTIHASVVSAKPEATVLSLACPPGTSEEECGVFPRHFFTYGPSIYEMDMSGDQEGYTMIQDCSVGKTTAVCKKSAHGSAASMFPADIPGSSTDTYSGEGGWDGMTSLPVTITAGAEKLAASADATPTSNAASVTKGSAAAASTGGSVSSTLATSTGAGASGSNSASAVPAQNTTGAAAGIATSNLGLIGAAAALFAGVFF